MTTEASQMMMLFVLNGDNDDKEEKFFESDYFFSVLFPVEANLQMALALKHHFLGRCFYLLVESGECLSSF